MTVALPVWGVADALAARPAQPANEGMPMAAMPCNIQQSTTWQRTELQGRLTQAASQQSPFTVCICEHPRTVGVAHCHVRAARLGS